MPALPMTNEPPKIHSITGLGVADASLGAQTLRVRQSSLELESRFFEVSASSCGHSGPGACAAIGFVQGIGGAGGFQRRSPTGGAAKGMAKKVRVEPV